MNTRKHPRTLSEAFGPYTSGPVHPMPEKGLSTAEKVMCFGIAPIVFVLVVAIAAGWMQ